MHGQGFQSPILNIEETELRFVFSDGDSLCFMDRSNHWNRFEGKWGKSHKYDNLNSEINFNNYWLKQIDSTSYAVERGLGQANKIPHSFIHKESLLLFPQQNKILLYSSIAIIDFQKLFNSARQLYSNNRLSFLLWLFLAVFVLIVSRYIFIVSIWKRRKKNIPLLQENYLTLDKSILILNEIELEILVAFCKSKRRSLDDICNLDCFSEYSKIYRKKLAIDTIKQLQDRISSDKRIKHKLRINLIAGKKVTYKLIGRLLIYRGWFNHIIN